MRILVHKDLWLMTNNCSLKYRFHHVEKRKPERISIALPFGKAIHAAEELFYQSLKHGSHKEPLNALLERFEAVLCQSLEKNAGTPVVWKKNMLDQAGAFAMGKSMLSAFYETIDLSGYAYLLAANKYVFPTSPVNCRFDVLRKLKRPKLEHVLTVRTAQNRKRFARIASAVLAGIDAGIYMPQPNFMCSDCSHADACRTW